jgi:hypothetical protein
MDNFSARRAHRRAIRFAAAVLGGLLVAPAVALAPAQAVPDLPLPDLLTSPIEPVVTGAGSITGTGLACANTDATSPTESLTCVGDAGLTTLELTGLSQVVLEAVPAPGWEFQEWLGGWCVDPTSTTCTIDSGLLGALDPVLHPEAVFVPVDDPAPCDVVPLPEVCDTDPPVTKITSAKTTPTTALVAGSTTKERTATFEFKAYEADENGAATATETEGATFECKLAGPGHTADFAACQPATPGKQVYSNLLDGTYTFSVRATDVDGNVDATPETFLWKVDATAPDTFISRSPSTWLLSRSASYTYGANEPVSSVQCALDGQGRACGLTSASVAIPEGTHVFSVFATDKVGNVDATPATDWTTRPMNNTSLKHSKGWKQARIKGAYLKTGSVTTKKGATLVANATGARRIALVVSKGKGFGTVKVKLGSTVLKKVSLASKRSVKKKLVSIKSFATPTSGKVTVVVVSSGKKVVVEGLGIATR